MSFQSKYLKYKTKYLELKNANDLELLKNEEKYINKQYGGIDDKIECKDLDKVGFNNTLGTCWNISIISLLLYSNNTSDEVQSKLLTKTAKELVDEAIEKKLLITFLPQNLKELVPRTEEDYIILPEKYILIVEIIDELKKRFNIKLSDINAETTEASIESLPLLRRANSEICEVTFQNLFMRLFDITDRIDYKHHIIFDRYHKIESATFVPPVETFLLVNLLSIILLDSFVDLQKYQLVKLDKIDINKLDDPNTIGIIATSGGGFYPDGHSNGFFKCKNLKIVNNNFISNYNYKDLFIKFNELIDLKHRFSICLTLGNLGLGLGIDNVAFIYDHDSKIIYKFIKNTTKIKTDFFSGEREEIIEKVFLKILEVIILVKKKVNDNELKNILRSKYTSYYEHLDTFSSKYLVKKFYLSLNQIQQKEIERLIAIYGSKSLNKIF